MWKNLAIAAFAFAVYIAFAFVSGSYILLLAVPILIAAAFVASRRMHPLLAGLLGIAITFGLIFALVFPFIVYNAAQGNFDNTAHCDGFCMTNEQGFAFATFILLFLAVPTSLAGGLISFFASLVTPRRPRFA
jgi:hypothetical protein